MPVTVLDIKGTWSGLLLNIVYVHISVLYIVPISVAGLGASDARPTGDQEVVGSTPPGRQHSFVKIDNEIFYGHSLPSADSRRAGVSFWRKNVHDVSYITRLED